MSCCPSNGQCKCLCLWQGQGQGQAGAGEEVGKDEGAVLQSPS